MIITKILLMIILLLAVLINLAEKALITKHSLFRAYTGKKLMGLTNKGDSICYAVAYDDNYSLLKIEPFK